MQHKVYYIMGVSGSGKSTIGEELSSRMNIPFYDSDHFHPKVNIKKMSAGIPLNDEDRQPWLQAIHDFAKNTLPDRSLLIATSALKESYRQKLDGDFELDQVQWIFLYGSYDLLYERIADRQGHFMPETLLRSQFETLEIPHRNVIAVNVDQTVNAIVEEIMERIKGKS